MKEIPILKPNGTLLGYVMITEDVAEAWATRPDGYGLFPILKNGEIVGFNFAACPGLPKE